MRPSLSSLEYGAYGILELSRIQVVGENTTKTRDQFSEGTSIMKLSARKRTKPTP